MLNDFNLVNNEMTKETKVLEIKIEPQYTMPCGFMEDAAITIWSDNVFNIIDVLYNTMLRDYLMMVYDIDEEDFEKECKKYKYFDYHQNIIVLRDMIQSLDDITKEEHDAIEVMVHQYERCLGAGTRLPYATYVWVLKSIEDLITKLRLDFQATSYYTPLEARHSEYLKLEEFDNFHLIDNFYNFKDEEEE